MSQPYQTDPTHIPDPWAHPSTSVQGRYDDPRLVTVGSGVNHEIVLTIGQHEPVYVDALDLLRVVSHVALNLVYGPSPTEVERQADGGERI